jgi:RNA polymerase sigma-70 factor (ECF subfamily)
MEFNCLRTRRDPDLQEPCGLTYQQLGKLSDEQVMVHLSAGHGDAVPVLFDRYSRLVHSIASKIVRDLAEAEDLTQEIFVELCKTAAQFDGAKGTAKTWIIRLAYRRSLNRRRHLNFRNSHLLQDMGELENTASPEFAELQTLTPHESRRLVRQMLASLEPAQRYVLELVYFSGLTMRDVAERTGDSLDSVRHRYYRGMRKLRELVGQPYTQEVAPAAARERVNVKA